MYLVAIMDWYSRKVLSWRVSNTLETAFCINALEEALNRFGAPEIFNTDQGAQFTSNAFTQEHQNFCNPFFDHFLSQHSPVPILTGFSKEPRTGMTIL